MRQRAPRGFGLLSVVALALGSGAGCADDAEDPAGGGATGGGSPGDVTWCEVSEVLVAKCQRCHVGEGLNGAPFPLVSYADTQVEAAGVSRFQRMRAMLQANAMPPDDSKLTPAPPKPTAAESELVLTWIEQGARAVGGEDCE